MEHRTHFSYILGAVSGSIRLVVLVEQAFRFQTFDQLFSSDKCDEPEDSQYERDGVHNPSLLLVMTV